MARDIKAEEAEAKAKAEAEARTKAGADARASQDGGDKEALAKAVRADEPGVPREDRPSENGAGSSAAAAPSGDQTAQALLTLAKVLENNQSRPGPQSAPPPSSSHVPGGQFYVGGMLVNCNGEQVDEDNPAVRPPPLNEGTRDAPPSPARNY